MRTLVVLLLGLGAAVCVAAWIQFESPGAATTGPNQVLWGWRHTAQGWERAENWSDRKQTDRTGVLAAMRLPHPIVLTLFEVLCSALALLAFSGPSKSASQELSKANWHELSSAKYYNSPS